MVEKKLIKITSTITKKKIPKNYLSYKPEDMALAKEWASWAHSQMPWRVPKIDAYANAIRLCRESIKATHQGMVMIFSFIKRDVFWSKNCMSPVGIHLQKNGKACPKIDHILNAMNKRGLCYDMTDITDKLETQKTFDPLNY